MRAARSDTGVIPLLTLLGSDSLTVVLDFVSEGLLVLTPLFYREGWLCLRVYDFSNGDFSFFDGEVFVGLGEAFFGYALDISETLTTDSFFGDDSSLASSMGAATSY